MQVEGLDNVVQKSSETTNNRNSAPSIQLTWVSDKFFNIC